MEQRVFEIPLTKIHTDPSQPRKYFNEQDLTELADSIKEHGLLQPIMVKSDGDGTYLIIHGERRYRAHQLAAMPIIKCLIADKTDSQVQDARLVENLVRVDLSDMELAQEFQRRVDKGETHEQIAHSIRKSRTFVTQRLALMRLPAEQKQQLEQGKITFADARVHAYKEIPHPIKIEVKTQHCYAVTMETLEVLRVCTRFSQTAKFNLKAPFDKPTLQLLREAYHKDLATIERLLQ